MSQSFRHPILPYGAFSAGDSQRRLGVGVGDFVIDLHSAAEHDRLRSVDPRTMTTGRLNELLAAGRSTWTALRSELIEATLAGSLEDLTIPQSDVTMHLAWDVADYVDFYASRNHASNVGRMFRPNAEPLLPNWLHLPVGYHGRSSTVVVTGTPIRRPVGQRKTPDGDITFGPSTRLDIELELGFVVGGQNELGSPIPIESAAEHLFGVVLLNDWSARDIQAWEYAPLGPFLGKSFATSVSSWVVPMDALSDARTTGPDQNDPVPFPYLQTDEDWALSLDLEVWMRPAGADEASLIVEVNAADALYWTPAQMLAHMTSNGATVRPGDLFGSGTVSGEDVGGRGSMLELSWSGRDTIDVGGAGRTFLEDGDEITLRGTFPGPDGRYPLGDVTGAIIAASQQPAS